MCVHAKRKTAEYRKATVSSFLLFSIHFFYVNILRGIYQITCATLIKCQRVKNQVGCCQKAPFFLSTATKWQHFRLRRFSQKTSGVNGEVSYGARGDGSSRREISVHSPVTPRPPRRFDPPVTQPRSRRDPALICPWLLPLWAVPSAPVLIGSDTADRPTHTARPMIRVIYLQKNYF